MLARRSVSVTGAELGPDGPAYERLMQPLVENRTELLSAIMSPFDPLSMVRSARRPGAARALGHLALGAARSAAGLVERFETPDARALIAGLAAHSILPLARPPSGAVALALGLLAHDVGWPVAQGGSQRIADALVSLLRAEGGRVECGQRVTSLSQVADRDAALFDVSPSALAAIAGDRLPLRYRRSLRRFRHGPGVCKVDWVLDGPIPWAEPRLGAAGVVHLGGTFEQVAAAEAEVWAGRHPRAPFVLLAQQSLFDGSRIAPPAPSGAQAVWAYCHTPFGSTLDVSEVIASMVQDAAPGFRDRVLDTHVMTAMQMQAHNPNYVGGDISGGVADLRQTLARPVPGPHPWRTPIPGVYLCSSSTPPGGGVHGMCGWHAAQCALADVR